MYMGKPVYTLPGNSFDQQFCGYVIQQNHLGISHEKLTFEHLREFMQNRHEYRENILSKRGLTKSFNGLEILMQRLTASFGV